MSVFQNRDRSDSNATVSAQRNAEQGNSRGVFAAVGKVGNGLKTGAMKGVSSVGSVVQDFKDFINKGSVFDLAVAVVIGAAFSAVVNSMVKDLFTPILSLALDSVSLDDSYVVMACPKNNVTKERPERKSCIGNFTTKDQANTLGAITWNYGAFLNTVISFIIIAVIVFFIVKAFTATFRRKKSDPTTKDCIHCCKEIPIKATRCAFCTHQVPEAPVEE